ncbi:MAG: hypothetical protein JXB39_00600 [Deltaproteobacteria bacterium]|nr:hypothetical protein [Deltaproteobacteria bacterium]
MRRSLLAPFLLASLLAVPASARAGGIGFLGAAGLHNERVYYYNDSGVQGIEQQYRPTLGGGIEAVLGDRDDRIQGVARGFYLRDAPQTEPTPEGFSDPVFDIRDAPMHCGIATVGVVWGLLGDPGAFQVHLVTHLGAGIVTYNGETQEPASLEFAIGEAGGGAEYQIARNVEVYLDAVFSGRYRKRFYPGANGVLGVRVIFD